MPVEFDALARYLEGIHPLPPSGREKLERFLRIEDVGKDEYFIRAGKVPSKIGFLFKGWLRHFHIDAEGREYIRYFCSGGNFVSSQSALINGTPSDFSIQAIEASRLVVFDYRDWLGLSESHPSWAAIHKAVLEHALEISERRERSLVLDDAATRYRKFLEEYPGAEAHIRQYDIASYLGVSPVTLSRIRRGP